MPVFAAILILLDPRVGLGAGWGSLPWLAGCQEEPVIDAARAVRKFFVRDYGEWFDVVQAADKAANECVSVRRLFFFDAVLVVAFLRLSARSPGVPAAGVNEASV